MGSAAVNILGQFNTSKGTKCDELSIDALTEAEGMYTFIQITNITANCLVMFFSLMECKKLRKTDYSDLLDDSEFQFADWL